MPPYIGEIRMFGGNFAPAGWAFCQGQTMAISENDTLFALIGTTYGGDGQETFRLPDLQGRIPLHMGSNAGTSFQIGELGGTPEVTLTQQTTPNHNHFFMASTIGATANTPVGNLTAESVSLAIYEQSTPDTPMNGACIQNTGGSQPHENMQPYLCISFIISLYGVFPTQS